MSPHAKLSRIRPRSVIALTGRAAGLTRGVGRRHHHDLNHFIARADQQSEPLAHGKGPAPFKLAVKDNIATKDLPTTCASAILAEHASPFEATIVRQLRERGAVVVGKTNMDEFGVVPYANSLDTVGLLASSVVALEKLVFETGLDLEHDPNDPTSLSSEFRQSQAQQAPEQRRLKVGLPLEYNIEELDPQIHAAWVKTAETLQELGVDVVPVSLPSTRHALSAYYVIAPAEASSNLAKYDGVRYGKRGEGSDATGQVLYSETRGNGFGDEVKRRILLGSYSLSSEAMDNYFIQSQKVRKLVQRDFDRVFRLENPLYDEQQFDLSDMTGDVELENKLGPQQVDFLLCPTAPSFPPRIEDVEKQTPVQSYTNDVFTVPASLAGLPAISIPVPIQFPSPEADDSRKVAGLQIIGQYWDDKRVLQIARRLAEKLAA
ncbi:glutamyl-tRNA(Gln) amidotransferase subunit A [Verticillium alfalfae VaMs.102]|uniref:Glutamyl-tRNA(Gln) amidotransferase subunit A, mitochondrial n=1 Tax=Verticillium alfalfae (strain VaMs.102 / ATCC MYA-4576 / FGSC 10136) TaxID=526221 RepID=C9S9P6_VERA1|nr:glutamyl-tRNA(Gln) amidotransferase subunit A [Verticillium alfalfae VaMs.102]EEY16109.1 glutamyl-tRNA(Gln) amidotransferase subunit A [Verticillium alfalfae VaMs.102]